ncbi:MAG: hypothetical protein AABZ74_18015 [Cyanobacteriota bacterium]
MKKEDKIKEMSKRHTKCVYYDYELDIIGETETAFIISNNGESVSKDDSINIQFMLIKDTLGFKQVDIGTFQNEISKFDEHIKLKAIKLISDKNWLLRVAQEKDDKYLLITTTNKPDSNGWYDTGSGYMKWVLKNDVKEIQDFISYWKK